MRISLDIIVRNETQIDYRRVEEITREAFAYPDRIERGGIGCPYEHWMVHELRKRDGILELSLVATVNDEIVGHVICSKAEVRQDGNSLPVLNLGPISVRLEYQRLGVGKALINELIMFGFVEASEFSISDSEGYNYDSFMGMELIPGYLSVAKGGRFYESDIYNDDLNRETVKEFDAEFIT